jgi:acetyl-CoA carboxylase biotin carboxyl carrier protein
MSPEISDILSAMEFAAKRGLRHFRHDDGKTRLALWRDGPGPSGPVPDLPGAAPPAPARIAMDPAETRVVAPLPGLCHMSPDPASPPFVTPGARVNAGQTLCLIEAMKVMTAVTAPEAGTISAIHAVDGAALAAGAPLMEIRR